MKNKFKILVLIMMALLICSCGTKDEEESSKSDKKVEEKVKYFEYYDKKYSYDIDAPYFGDIVFGKTKINMISSYYTLRENDDISRLYSGVDSYKIKSSGDKFTLSTNTYTNKYYIRFSTYTDIYEKNEIHMYDSSKSIKLPKNITYSSTADDVIKAYGEPDEREECIDVGYCITKNSLNQKAIEVEELTYKYEKNNCLMILKLRFDKESKTLCYVSYEIEIPEVK